MSGPKSTTSSPTDALWEPSDSGRKPRRGDLLELDLERLDERGQAIGSVHGFTVKLRSGLPGARVRVEVSRRRRNEIFARTLETLEPSPHASAPRCEHFGTCGGCRFQDFDYASQLEAKRGIVERLFRNAGVEAPVAAPLGCESVWNYRNKMDYSFSAQRWLEEGELKDHDEDPVLALGLHPKGWFQKVLEVHECTIQFPEATALVASVRELTERAGLSAWDTRTHSGLLRHLVLRKGVHTGEILVQIVTDEDVDGSIAPLAQALAQRHPEITTLVHGTCTRPAQVAICEREHVYTGPGVIRERLHGLEFEVSASSFFQTNTPQAERMFERVLELAGIGPDDRVYDLYCGTGAASLIAARHCREVWGFEIVESAVEDARRNATRNGAHNAHFVAGDVRHSIVAHTAEHGEPDVWLVDPPRAGVHPDALALLGASKARRLVYVSCNPLTAARDAKVLTDAGWVLGRVEPVDLFPHTPHIECILELSREPETEADCLQTP